MLQLAYQTHLLDNGLKVIIHEDHSIPKAVVDIIYKVGSKDEEEHRTGFAHLFEHLMFEGSKHIPNYDGPLQRVGGTNNAFTTSDITNYYLSVPSNQLETAFWLESDRMLELAFSQQKLDIQKSVVIEEYKQRYLNKPYGDAHLKLREIHFNVHPYRWATIGKDISHIEGASLDEVKDFFYSYYAPNNATLVVAGDVNPEEVLALANKWFGPIPKRALKKKALPQEPAQQAARQTTTTGEVPFKAVYKMFHIPAHTDKAYYTADILTDLLSSGKSARLYQALVKEQQLASSISAFSWGAHDPGMISINAQLVEGVEIEQYETALQQELDALQQLEEAELGRVRNKLQATFVLDKTTILNKAMGLALCDALGNPDLVNTTPQIYEDITATQVRSAAAKILAPHNGSSLYYLPQN